MVAFGLGLAAVGRPGYINLGRADDLPADRSVEAMRSRAHAVLDAAYAVGIRYFDAARSYGRAEEFLAGWLRSHPDIDDVAIGSKWGYTYTADWRVDAPVHEVKDHSVAVFTRQIGETRALLGDRLNLYQIHSVTPDSPALTDQALHRRLAALAAQGVRIGLSTSGPRQAEAIRAALRVTVGGSRLFEAVQATYNVLETSAGPALAEAHEAGWTVVVKEALANGRLTDAHLADADLAGADLAEQPHDDSVLAAVASKASATVDAVALAAVAVQPWADIVLSGAATVAQLESNVAAARLHLAADQLEQLSALALPASEYWAQRSRMAWA
ncbi:aldo/keto reductase [Catenulispora sp. NL8]|uniref:Aldo/keto reductase n=1 Tax=Catenulispora pinistramenti TaxID=2705254 RepID=A0ABS5L874_9ACTN|nr:aldo/keto reductase [Catenulispora pinistramenti]MBS2554374.1 aldo/keto reductase [Catenulispora pinistramenti]